MEAYTATATVKVPREEVFAYLADFERHLEWAGKEEFGLERIEVVTPPPTGVGTRFHSVGRNIFRCPNRDVNVVTRFEPPHVLEFDTTLRLASAVVRLRHRYTVEPALEGSVVSHTLFEPTPLTLAGRVLLRIMSTAGKKQLANQTDEGIQAFARAAERHIRSAAPKAGTTAA